MLDVKNRSLQVPVTNEMYSRMLRHLKKDYKPFLTEVKEEFCKRFSIDFSAYQEKGIFSAPIFQKICKSDKLYAGDIFIGKKMEQYFLRIPSDRRYIDVTCISRVADMNKEFDQFCEIISQAIFPLIKSTNIGWKDIRPMSDRYSLLKNDLPIFEPNDDDYKAVTALESAKSREMLSRIKATPHILFNDLGDDNELLMIGGIVQKMEQLGLISREYIVYCHKTGKQITRVDSMSSIEEASQKGFKCFHCGRLISKEKIDQSISITDYGTYITRGSYWLAVRLLSILKSAGLYGEEILADYNEGEVDIVDLYFNCDNRLILAEIKVDPYDMKDAYLFYNKALIYQPHDVIFIFASPVKQEIKDFFKYTLPNLNIIYIDNLIEFPQLLSAFLSQKRNEYALDLLAFYNSLTYLDFTPLIASSFFGMEVETIQEEQRIDEIIKIKPEEEELIKEEMKIKPEEEFVEDIPAVKDEEPDDLINISDFKIPDLSEEEEEEEESSYKDELISEHLITDELVSKELASEKAASDEYSPDSLLPDEFSSDSLLSDEFSHSFDTDDSLSMDENSLEIDDFSFDDVIGSLGNGLDDFSLETLEINMDDELPSMTMESDNFVSGSFSSDSFMEEEKALPQLSPYDISQEVIDTLSEEGVIGKGDYDIKSFLKPLDDLGIKGSCLSSQEGLLISYSLGYDFSEILAAVSVELDRRFRRFSEAMDINDYNGILLEASDGKIIINSREMVLSSVIDEPVKDDMLLFKDKLNEFLKKLQGKKYNREYIMNELLDSLGKHAGVIGGLIGSEEGLLMMSSLPGKFSSEAWIAYMFSIYQAAEDAIVRLSLGELDRYIVKTRILGKDVKLVCHKNRGIIVIFVISDEMDMSSVICEIKALSEAAHSLLDI